MKKEKEGYIWRRKIFFAEEKKTEKKKKENIWSPERKKYGEGIGGRYLEKKNTYMQKTCDVAGKAILAKKKLRKSRQNVNRDKNRENG